MAFEVENGSASATPAHLTASAVLDRLTTTALATVLETGLGPSCQVAPVVADAAEEIPSAARPVTKKLQATANVTRQRPLATVPTPVAARPVPSASTAGPGPAPSARIPSPADGRLVLENALADEVHAFPSPAGSFPEVPHTEEVPPGLPATALASETGLKTALRCLPSLLGSVLVLAD